MGDELKLPMALHIALDFADNPLRHDTLRCPADTIDEVREALVVVAAAYRKLLAARAQGQPTSADDREEIARLIALAGLGTTDGSRRGMPENWGDEALWGARILECIPTEAAERCFELTDAILARQGQPTGGGDREEIARITSRIEEEREKAASYPLGDPMCSRHGGIRDGLKEALEIILARQGPGPGEAVADGWLMVPRDDDSRQFSDSALPIEMIDAGVAVFDRVHLDLAGHNGKDVPDWDDGMVAVAVYRAMIAATPTRESGNQGSSQGCGTGHSGEQLEPAVGATAALAPKPAGWRYEFSAPRQENGHRDGSFIWHVGYAAEPPIYPVRNLTPLYELGGSNA